MSNPATIIVLLVLLGFAIAAPKMVRAVAWLLVSLLLMPFAIFGMLAFNIIDGAIKKLRGKS
jgi:hypothetical protein